MANNLPESILVRYGEIGLKGRNRPQFEQLLARRIKEALGDGWGGQVKTFRGRLLVQLEPAAIPAALERLAKVFGIVGLHPTYVVPQTMEDINRGALAALNNQWDHLGRQEAAPPMTFKVAARRGDKNFPLNSMEINRQVGAHLLAAHDDGTLAVDVHQPEILVNIEVRDGRAYVYAGGADGPGGLPVGASGKITMLLSGGIDSPVALWMMLKRGAQVEAVHFFSPPFTSQRSLEKVVDLCRILARWGGPIPLHVVPFTAIQTAIHEEIPADFGITVMRRLMFRISEAITEKTGGLALATGESMGQVASQTLESMATIAAVTTLPVLRPLIGLDKAEITALAQKIGTYDVSILPYADCCSLFVPRHPQTRPHPRRTARLESRLPLEQLLTDAINNTERRLITAYD